MTHRAPGVPTMPQSREWPPALRRLAKFSLGVIYVGSATAGWHVVLGPEHQGLPWWSISLGVLAGMAGFVALAVMLMELWMVERVAAWALAFALTIYAVVDAVRLMLGGTPDLGGTSLLWVSAAAVGLRIVHLWAFDLNLNAAKRKAAAAREARALRDDGRGLV